MSGLEILFGRRILRGSVQPMMILPPSHSPDDREHAMRAAARDPGWGISPMTAAKLVVTDCPRSGE